MESRLRRRLMFAASKGSAPTTAPRLRQNFFNRQRRARRTPRLRAGAPERSRAGILEIGIYWFFANDPSV
jgi:hypothetical protein